MTTKHTEGPWVQSLDMGYPVIKSATRNVAIICENGMRKTVAGIDELVANTKLIAAAPDMLEALHKAVDLITAEYCSHAWPHSAEKSECYAQEILAVIKKATLGLFLCLTLASCTTERVIVPCTTDMDCELKNPGLED